ncbi:hypothetical protein ACLOJK_025168 [Asimina triloba]
MDQKRAIRYLSNKRAGGTKHTELFVSPSHPRTKQRELFISPSHPIPPISGARTGMLDHQNVLFSGPEEEIPDSKAKDDGDKDTAIVGHEGKHEEISESGIESKEDAAGESSRVPGGGLNERGCKGGHLGLRNAGEELESEASVFHVLVEGGEEEESQ